MKMNNMLETGNGRSERMRRRFAAVNSGIINVKMLANQNLIGYYFLPEVYEKEVSKQEIKVLRMLLLDVFDHVRDGQWERNLKMGDAN